MSWAITIDNLRSMTDPPPEVEAACSDNPAYREDILAAFTLAKHLDFASVALSGGRTASPYGGPEHVVISVVGFDDDVSTGHAVTRPSFSDEMRATIEAGLHDEADSDEIDDDDDEMPDGDGGVYRRGPGGYRGASLNNGPNRPMSMIWFNFEPLSTTSWELI